LGVKVRAVGGVLYSLKAIIWTSYWIEKELKNEKRGSVSSFPEIDKKEEGIGSHQSKIVDPSQPTASPHLRNWKG
jgi:hypothetical protein